MESYIRNIVIESADARALGDFYVNLLGIRILREDWLVIARDERSFPRLAFDRSPEHQPPRWHDPDHPQQLHLELPVYDLEGAGELALRLGAALLQDEGEYRTYADPAGHAFCLYHDATEDAQFGRPLSGRIGRIVYDCFSPRALAAFYEELLGMRARQQDNERRVVIARDGGSLPMLAFQHAHFTAPRWPNPPIRNRSTWICISTTARPRRSWRYGSAPSACRRWAEAARSTPTPPRIRSASARRTNEMFIRQNQSWVMRRRTQREMDQLVAEAEFEKVDQYADGWGIFSLSLPRRR